MENDFFKKALKWYNTIYISPACERLMYFFILVVSLGCLYYSIETIKVVRAYKNHKNTYVIPMEHKDQESVIRVTKMQEMKDQTLSLLELIISRYVINFESLQYDKSDDAIGAIRKKMTIIKNLSSTDVYDKYVSNINDDENGDMSLAILRLKKIATIEKIELIYDHKNIFEYIYAVASSSLKPSGAKVYFTTETTSEKSKKQSFVATMLFYFYFNGNMGENSKIEFKVKDYFVEKNVKKVSEEEEL